MFKVQQAHTLLNTEYAVPPPAIKQPFRAFHIKQDSASSLLVDNMDSSSSPSATGDSNATKPVTSSSPDSSSGYSSSMRSSQSSPASSRATSPPAKSNRASTPPSPSFPEYYNKSTATVPLPSASSSTLSTKTFAQPIPRKTSTVLSTNQDDFLQLIEPAPVSPPTYDSLPPGGCPRYPIILNEHAVENCTPAYSPSIYKIGVVSRKLEWLTPYEPAPTRSWKHVIMELNSTQLNFYQIPATLEAHLLQFRAISQSPDRVHELEESELKNLNSCFTSDADLQFYKFCKRLHLLNDVPNGSLLDDDLDPKATKKLNSKRLLRSYSLQRSRIGLAIDYKKRPNVLRLRIESEQLLINFQSTKDLIEWNMAIGVGRDVSLDLNERELPRFRTVPRRRRRNRAESLPATPTPLNLLSRNSEPRNRNRSNSEPNSSFKGKLSKLKSKLSSSSSSSRNNNVENTTSNSKTLSPKSRSQSFNNSSPARISSLEMARLNLSPAQMSAFEDLARNDVADDGFNYDVDVDDEEDDEYYDEEEAIELVARNSILPNNHKNNNNVPKSASGITNGSTQSTTRPSTSNTSPSRAHDYEEDDIENLSDLHQSDDEEEDEEDDDVILADEDVFPEARGPSNQVLRTSYRDHKWDPVDTRVHSKRKFYRNCLRCIKPLTMDDTWVNKSLCRPTTLSPLNFTYLRAKYNNNCLNGQPSTFSSFFSNSSSSSSLTSMNSIATSTAASSSGGFRKRSFSFKEINGFNLPDSALTKVPNHFLKEYIVGSHGLIPKDI